jgi:hypothetical protein
LISSLTFVTVSGLLSIQISGVRAGAVYDLSNKVVAVAPPRLPILQMAAAAALYGLTMYGLLLGVRKLHRSSRLAFLAAYAVGSVLLIAAGIVLVVGAGPAESTLITGLAEGWQGWLARGGMDPAVHAITLLAVGVLLATTRSRNTALTAGGREDTIQTSV